MSRRSAASEVARAPGVRPAPAWDDWWVARGAPAGPWVGLLLLAVVAATVYLNTLPNAFVYDDVDLVVENEKLRSWSNIPRLFQAAWRPLKRLSLMVDYHLWGLNPMGYHATNILFHVLATLALAKLVQALARSGRAAFAAGLLFATHPVLTESVAVITHRKETMGTLFLLLALLAHVRGTPRPRTWALVFVCFVASILSKESVGAAFPLLLLACDLVYREGDLKRKLRRLAPVLAPLAVTVGLLMLLRLVYQGKSLFPFFRPGHLLDLSSQQSGSYPVVLGTVLRAYWRYVRLLVAPVGLSADHGWSFSSGPLEGWVPAATIGLAIYLGVAVWMRSRDALISLGLLWIPLGLLPASNLIPLTPWFLAERFLCLPAAGFCMALGAALARLADPGAGAVRRRGAAVALVLLTLGYAAQTIRRNRDWKDNLTIWTVTARQNPESILARGALGTLYHRQGRLAEAVEEYEFVLSRRPDHLSALTNLCDALPKLGQLARATEVCQIAVELHPSDGKLHNNLGNCYKMQGQTERALREYRLAVRLNRRLAEPWVNLGAHQAKSGDVPGAARAFERAVEIDPGLAEAHFNLAIVRQVQGDLRAARLHLHRVLSLDTRPALKEQARELLRKVGE